jgi:hypothetical protein
MGDQAPGIHFVTSFVGNLWSEWREEFVETRIAAE